MKKKAIDDFLAKKISIGVTGFSRAGKTVFIGSLVQALLTADAYKGKRGQGPLAGFGPFDRGTFLGARIRDDLNSAAPHFPFRRVRDALYGEDPHWPERTEELSRLIMDLIIQDKKKKKFGLPNPNVQIEIVDYPGEWLVDLPMLDTEYHHWSSSLIERAVEGQRKHFSRRFFDLINSFPPADSFDEELAEKLADAWRTHLSEAANQGLVFNQPGRLLRPGTHINSPVLRLVPLPESWSDSGFYKGMTKRYKEYRRKIIKPFYKKHFSRIDRQLVLVDLLHALSRGKDAFNEMGDALGATLKSFDYGNGGVLDRLMGNRTSHVLFAATKADHVTRQDRSNLRVLLEDILLLFDDSAVIRATSAKIEFMALASIRATKDERTDADPKRQILKGQRKGKDQFWHWDPGELPLDLPPDWNNLYFEFMEFEPPENKLARKEGFPAINLGKTLDFLID